MRHYFFILLLFFSGSLREAGAEEIPSKTEEPVTFGSILKNLDPILNIGAPIPISLGAHYSLSPQWSFLLSAGYVPISLGTNALRSGALDLAARWHPFLGSFFISSGLGYQSIQFHTNLNLGTLSTDPGPVPSTVGIYNFYFGVGAGWLWHLGAHWLIGFDFGLQIPLIASGGIKVDSSSTAGSSLERASTDAFGYFASYAIPRITLLRLGWRF